MSRRIDWRLAAGLLAGLVLLRAWPFVWWAGAHFDSDQAIVGLMAKHIGEGRAFPLYYYGQPYLLALEAWLAAPVMWLLGPTVTALKLPLVAINIAAVWLLLWAIVRDAGLRPLLAAVAVLPLALPSAGVAARVVEANGGNVEPWLYIGLLWVTRTQPWLFGLVLGFGMAHREFTVYGAVAVAILDGISGRLFTRAALARWSVVAVAALAVRAVLGIAQPFASALGPGSRGDDPLLLAADIAMVGNRICIDPSEWTTRTSALLTEHLPRLVGGFPAPLQQYGVLTSVFSGYAGLSLWVLLIVAVGLSGGVRAAWTGIGRPAPGQHIGGYLMLVGLVSTLVYGYLTCSSIRVETLRYNLLGTMLPVGAIVVGLQGWRHVNARAGLVAAVALWCVVNLTDVMGLAREYVLAPPPDRRQAIAAAMEQRGIVIAWSEFRNAYHITFLAQERVRVSARDYVRILEYATEATRANAPTLATDRCAGGEELLPDVWICGGKP